ncbi:MAG: hypothetical protein ABI480_08500 [Chitinophagaceae bacterium]
MKRINNISLSLLIALFVIVAGCDKNEVYKTKEADPEVHFTGGAIQSYSVVVNPAPAYTVTVGTTDVADVDRTVTFHVSSPTGATSGNQYVLSNSTGILTIPAGQATASFSVLANFASYSSGRKDTLVFTLDEPSVKVAGFSNVLKLALRGPCFEGDIVASDFLGVYARTIETFATNPPYGPYTTTVSNVTPVTATSANVTVTNIWDNGWGPITFLLDWTDPANRIATVVSQAAISGSDAGDLNATYAGQTIAVRPFAGTPGTFSWCNGTLTLKMQLGVTNVGYFNALYTVNMAR